MALEGRFDDHHRLMLRLHLRHIDDLSAMIVELDTNVDELMAPFDEAATRPLSIPGVGKRTAEVVVAEIGVDMSRFPTAGHLAVVGRVCPGNHESAGKRRSGKARKGNEALRTAMRGGVGGHAYPRHLLGGAAPTIRRRWGIQKRRARRSSRWGAHDARDVRHLLHYNTGYAELGTDYFDKRNDADARQRYLVRELEKLGNTVILEPAA